MAERSTWGSRLGFVLASAGAAVGLGAIWKFPYLVGSNGGSAFLFPFIVLTFSIGLVLLIAELTVGRAGAGCIVTAFRKLGGKHWGRAGYLGVITGFLILSFYSAIGGWTIAYFVNACLGSGLVADQAQLGAHFASISGDPELAIGYQALFLIITAWVVAYGVSSGIERLSKVLMPLLFILMIIIIVRSLFRRVAFHHGFYVLLTLFGKRLHAHLRQLFGQQSRPDRVFCLDRLSHDRQFAFGRTDGDARCLCVRIGSKRRPRSHLCHHARDFRADALGQFLCHYVLRLPARCRNYEFGFHA